MLQLVPAYGKLNSFYETLVQSTKVKPTSVTTDLCCYDLGFPRVL